MKKIIYWKTKDRATMAKIKRTFGISGITVNGESIAEVTPENEDAFNGCIRRGFFITRNKPITQ